MSKHPTDHTRSHTGGRVKAFLAIAKAQSQTAWRGLWQRPYDRADQNHRLVQYVRIEKGREV